MITDLKQEPFTHAQCLNCKHMAMLDKFEPKTVPIEECKTMKITITENSGGIELTTIQCKCPLCGSFNVEVLYGSEVN